MRTAAFLLAVGFAAGCASGGPGEAPPPAALEPQAVLLTAGPALPARLRALGGPPARFTIALAPGDDTPALRAALRLEGVREGRVLAVAGLRPGTAWVGWSDLRPPDCAAALAADSAWSLAASPGFGCALEAATAAQVAEPLDLAGNGAAPGPDPERAALPVSRYRAFGQESVPTQPAAARSTTQ